MFIIHNFFWHTARVAVGNPKLDFKKFTRASKIIYEQLTRQSKSLNVRLSFRNEFMLLVFNLLTFCSLVRNSCE